MEKFKKDVLFNYQPSNETYKMGMLISEKLGKLNVRLSQAFPDHKQASRIFAFIESKYSSKIEGIYTTLFDIVNSGKITKQQKLIEPILNELFKSKNLLSKQEIIEIAAIMNTTKDNSKRWQPSFGIYKNNNELIYQPPMNKEEVSSLLGEVINKATNDRNIIQIIHTHILFEKIHPFVDANGRIGRLIFQKSLAKLINFSNVLPISWSLFKKLPIYYDIFNISTNEDIDKGVQAFLNIILFMYDQIKLFIMDLEKYVTKNIEHILDSSHRITKEIGIGIILTLQTRSAYLQNHYNLNSRTIDSFFEKINQEMPFNRKMISNNVMYWNIELEELIDKYFS